MFPASSKGGGMVAAFPDVCKTPTPGSGPIPVPYANQIDGMAEGGNKAAQATQKEMIDNAAKKGYKTKSATGVAIASQGDEVGSAKGIVSSKTMGKAEFQMGSMDVKFEGKNVNRAFDLATHNR